MKKRMQDFELRITEEHIAKYFPGLPAEEHGEAAENYSAYLRLVARIYDRLEDEGRLRDVLLRAQYDKRNRDKPASQNEKGTNDDTPTPNGDSNGSAS